MKTRTAYRFGEFRLNPATHELLCGEREVALPPKAFGCLAYLVEHRDRAVGRDEMISAVWGRVDCADSVVKRAIFDLRQALTDAGDNVHYVKSVRGIGYRWVAPVDEETVEVPNDNGGSFWRHHAFRRGLAPAVIGMAVVLALSATWLWRTGDPDLAEHSTFVPAEGEIALLLPVDVEPGPNGDHSWIRLGLMDMIAERLRAAGQATVPSDTVIALMRGLPEDFNPDGLDKLTTPTGAGLVLATHAQAIGGRWRVSLRTLEGQPPLMATAESHDVLEAARIAVDAMAMNLGLSPVDDLGADAELTRFVQRVRAYTVAQQLDAAQALLDQADPKLAAHPKVRYRQAVLEFENHRLDSAGDIATALVNSPATQHDPILEAALLHMLAAIHIRQNESEAAIEKWERAARLLEGLDASSTHGVVYKHLGYYGWREHGDLDRARAYMAQARRIHEAFGDVEGLGGLDLNAGFIEARRENYMQALKYFKAAVQRLAAVQAVANELLANAHIMHTYNRLLDPRSALVYEPRVAELAAAASRHNDVAWAHLVRMRAFRDSGRRRDFQAVMDELQALYEADPDLSPFVRAQAANLSAELALDENDFDRAIESAEVVFDQWVSGDTTAANGSWAGLILVRASLKTGDLHKAGEVLEKLMNADPDPDQPDVKLTATLARAEFAAASGEQETAAAAYEWALAEVGDTPLRALRVAQSYVPWLLNPGPGGEPDPARALAAAEQLAVYSDQHYEAALLQLRTYHAIGPASAWRVALNRAQSLAGEREIPPELLAPPGGQQYQTANLGALTEDAGSELP